MLQTLSPIDFSRSAYVLKVCWIRLLKSSVFHILSPTLSSMVAYLLLPCQDRIKLSLLPSTPCAPRPPLILILILIENFNNQYVKNTCLFITTKNGNMLATV